MKRAKSGLPVAAALFACILFLSGCTPKEDDSIPPAGTSVTTTSEVFRQTATGLGPECERLGTCTCILDGIQTTCAIVFACLDAGFCERVATQ
jgi:hypothetical protein